ncbi:MAG: class I tRNA ligase family protein, partial [Candidatus Omnitrophota bacterium]
ILPPGYSCPKCGAREIAREKDILDVWFESGVSHQSVLRRLSGLGYPADLYLEGSDQHRGWFQSSIITAVGIENSPPYREVVTHGFIVDGDGKKMSKSLGNVISPQDLMKEYGADILRLWVASSNYYDDIRISDEIMKRTADAYRKIRNTFRYLVSNLYDFEPDTDSVEAGMLEEIDRWMLSRLGRVLKEVTGYYSEYLFHKVYRAVYNFCVYEVSSLFLDVAKDRLYTSKAASVARRSAQTVLYRILDGIVRVISPVLAFTADEVWREAGFLSRRCGSVHLSEWPDTDGEISSWIDDRLDNDWERLVYVREKVQKALELKRESGAIGSSLDASVAVWTDDAALNDLLKSKEAILPMLFMTSQVSVRELPVAESDKTGGAAVAADVAKAGGAKCVRCWNYSVSVGSDRAHPDICAKCAANIK